VHDPRALRGLPTSEQAGEAVHERAARVPGRRVYDDPGRLVDDEQVLVLVGDPERNVFADDSLVRPLRQLELELLTAGEAVALAPRLAVDDCRPGLDQPLCGRARTYLRQRSEEPVEPLARDLSRDDQLARRQERDRRDVSPIRSARNRIATPITMKESARLKAGQ
jgi:hypothetical protein